MFAHWVVLTNTYDLAQLLAEVFAVHGQGARQAAFVLGEPGAEQAQEFGDIDHGQQFPEGIIAGYAVDLGALFLTQAQALALLQRLPARARRDTAELELQLVLAPGYRVTMGWAAPELGRVLDRASLERARARFGQSFETDTGPAALDRLLAAIDLDSLALELRRELAGSKESRQPLLARLALVESLRASGVRPKWMILRRLPVVGPAVRPIVSGKSRRAS